MRSGSRTKAPAEAEPTAEQLAADLPPGAVGAPHPAEPRRRSDTVLIACRTVTGLSIAVQSPLVDADTGLPRLERSGGVTLNGTRADYDTTRPGCTEFAVTEVPRPLWEAWVKANADSPLLRNAVVFELVDEDHL